MKRFCTALILLSFLTACKNSGSEKIVEHRLLKDFYYTDSLNFVRAKESAFEPGLGSFRGKIYPAIIQGQPGAVSFYSQLEKKPELDFTLHFQSRKHSKLDVRVIVESDHPVSKQEFEVHPEQSVRINLKDFEERIVRITFQAKNRNLIGLGGILFWNDPMIRQLEENPAHQTKAIQAFRERQRRHNTLIFLFDALDPAHLGCYGYNKPTSPVIDSVAAEGVIFENAIAQAASTVPSTGSLLTGLYPEAHGVLHKESRLPDSHKTMAEYFQEAGFRTALFSANPNASSLTGYHQGFEEVWSLRKGRTISADEFVKPFASWIHKVRKDRFFAYLHIREPHWPYQPPRKYLHRFHNNPILEMKMIDPFQIPPSQERERILAAYDANLAFADAQFETMLKVLKDLGLHNNTIIIILSDHGEAFWQHGFQGHNYHVTEDIARIPMIFRFPGEKNWRGKREPYVVGSIDVLPTLADTYSFSIKRMSSNGKSLLPFLFNAKVPAGRYRLIQTGSRSLYGIRSDRFKYIYHAGSRRSEDEFFHLLPDPDEQTNVIKDYPITSEFYQVQLLKTLEQLERFRSLPSQENVVIDQETEEELRALGYVN